jgi:hypothetical protein
MVILLEYIESLIEPLIITIETIKKKEARTKIQNLILIRLSFIKEINGASYEISSMNSSFSNSWDISLKTDELT